MATDTEKNTLPRPTPLHPGFTVWESVMLGVGGVLFPQTPCDRVGGQRDPRDKAGERALYSALNNSETERYSVKYSEAPKYKRLKGTTS